MLKNYYAIALRNIRQNPLYAFINIFSLAIGLAACLVIYVFIADERSFDAFHTKSEAIYRLDEIQNFPGTNEQKVALSMPGMGPAIQKEFPEVSNYARFINRENQLVAKEDKKLLLPSIAYVDSTFLQIFDFELMDGDRATALNEPYSLLLTEETALKFSLPPRKPWAIL
ncbi:MAG: ABC transporter permease [Flammeovirgaceae bacterium]|nr:ABC transporter permease [Flammeovirgaceae bacterium]